MCEGLGIPNVSLKSVHTLVSTNLQPPPGHGTDATGGRGEAPVGVGGTGARCRRIVLISASQRKTQGHATYWGATIANP